MDVVRFDADAHGWDLTALVNRHLAAVVPGWGVPVEFIARLASQVPPKGTGETLCAVRDGRVVSSLRVEKGAAGEAGQSRDGTGHISWFLVDPDHVPTGTDLLAVARERLQALGATWFGAHFDIGVDPVYGIPDTWRHCRTALRQAGFAAMEAAYWAEEVWGGWVGSEPPENLPTCEGIVFERRVGDEETWFSAVAEGKEVGHCACVSDSSRGGLLPSLRGWGRLTDLWVDEDRRRRGIGAAVVARAVSWMRLAGCSRVVLAVPVERDGPEAQRFYPRLGWSRWARMDKVWRWMGGNGGGKQEAAP